VTAKVLSSHPGGGVRLNLLGREVMAQSKVSLTPGSTVRLVVERTSPQVVLALAGKQTATQANGLAPLLARVAQSSQSLPSNLHTLLGADLAAWKLPTALLHAARQVQEAAQELVRWEPGGDALRRTLAASGLGSEAGLAAALRSGGLDSLPQPGLRGLVWQLQQVLQEQMASGEAPEQSAAFKAFLQAAGEAAGAWEAQGRLSAELLARDSQSLFSLAAMLNDRLEQADLLLELPEREQEGERRETTRLVLFMRLSALGPLAVEAVIRGRAVTGRMVLESPEKAAFAGRRLPELTQRLEDLGFSAELTAQHRARPELEENSPLAELIRREGRYLSLTV
jgi:hypothetical protein